MSLDETHWRSDEIRISELDGITRHESLGGTVVLSKMMPPNGTNNISQQLYLNISQYISIYIYIYRSRLPIDLYVYSHLLTICFPPQAFQKNGCCGSTEDVTSNWCNWLRCAGLTEGRLSSFNVAPWLKPRCPEVAERRPKALGGSGNHQFWRDT